LIFNPDPPIKSGSRALATSHIVLKIFQQC